MLTLNQKNYGNKCEEMKNNQPDTRFVVLMKGHHFNFGNAIPPYVSVSSLNYTAPNEYK